MIPAAIALAYLSTIRIYESLRTRRFRLQQAPTPGTWAVVCEGSERIAERFQWRIFDVAAARLWSVVTLAPASETLLTWSWRSSASATGTQPKRRSGRLAEPIPASRAEPSRSPIAFRNASIAPWQNGTAAATGRSVSMIRKSLHGLVGAALLAAAASTSAQEVRLLENAELRSQASPAAPVVASWRAGHRVQLVELRGDGLKCVTGSTCRLGCEPARSKPVPPAGRGGRARDRATRLRQTGGQPRRPHLPRAAAESSRPDRRRRRLSSGSGPQGRGAARREARPAERARGRALPSGADREHHAPQGRGRDASGLGRGDGRRRERTRATASSSIGPGTARATATRRRAAPASNRSFPSISRTSAIGISRPGSSRSATRPTRCS